MSVRYTAVSSLTVFRRTHSWVRQLPFTQRAPAATTSPPTLVGQEMTGSSGEFKIVGFSFPSPTSQIYLVAQGGTIGGTANSTIALVTNIGSGRQLEYSDSGEIFFAMSMSSLRLAPFMRNAINNPSDPTRVAVSWTNVTGLENAASSRDRNRIYRA